MFGPKTLESISTTTKHRRVPYVMPFVFDFLVVGGGGTIGGGNGGGYYSGGGGAGGMICSGQALQGGGGNAQPAMVLRIGQSLTCSVAGEAVTTPAVYDGTQGSSTTLSGSGYSFTAAGGGAGAGNLAAATVGGSGGGGWGPGAAGVRWIGAAGTANQGYGGGNGPNSLDMAGGAGGGAGGAGANGNNFIGGQGGLGLAWIDGNVYAYGGRGAQGYAVGPPMAIGDYAANRPSGGAPNRGAGSGAAVQLDANGGCYGGAGVVIIAYFGPQIATGGNTVTQGLLGKTYHTFTTSGTFLLTG